MKTFTLFLSFVFLVLFSATAQTQHHSKTAGAPFKFSGTFGIPQLNYSGVMRASIPIKQVMKECTFFGGDSLNGFNFSAIEDNLKANNFNLYIEYKNMMRRAQNDFVSKKYNITIPTTSNSNLANTRSGNHQHNTTLNSACTNLDFEDGNFGNWTLSSGYNTNSNGNLTIAGAGTSNVNQDIYDCSDINLITAAYGNEPVGNFPGVDPNGGTTSARLGGFSINISDGYFTNCAGFHWQNGQYSNGEILEQTFLVSASNALVSYDYAVILNDGGHGNGQQPYFHVFVKDATTGAVLSSCNEFFVQAVAGSAPAGFTNSGLVNTSDGAPFYFQNWKSSSVNLTPYIGQNIKLQFVAAGCSAGAHPGWAYVDATCGFAELTLANLNPCVGTTTTLTAPAVAGGTYSWSGPAGGIVGATTNQVITINQSGTYIATVTPVQGAGCAYTISRTVTFINSTITINTINSTNCSDANVNLTLASSVSSNYTWVATDNVNTAGESLTNQAGGIITDVITNTSTSPQIVTYNVTPTDVSTGCIGTTQSVNITINPKPQPKITAVTTTSCSGANSSYSATIGSGSTLIWTVTGGSITNGQGTASVNVLWGNGGVGTVIVEETNSFGCKDTSIVNITINNTPAKFQTAGITDTICAGNKIIMGTAIAGVTTSVFTTPIGGTALGTINFTTPVLNTTTTYYFETVSTQGCFASITRDSIVITVNPLPTVPVITTSTPNDSICIGLTDSIKTTPIPGVVTTVYSAPTGGVAIGTLNYQTAPIVANTTYYFETKTISSSCLSKTTRDSLTIVALPRPAKSILSVTPNDSLCLGDSVQLKSTTNAPNTVKWYASNKSAISLGTDNIYVTPMVNQYYYAEVKNTLGCKASEIKDSVQVILYELASIPKLTTSTKPICEGDSIVLKANVTPASSTIYWLSTPSWADTIVKGSTFTSPNLTTNTTYYIVTKTKDNCRTLPNAFYAIPVIVKPLPHGTITSNAPNNISYVGQNIIFECNPATYDVYTWYANTKELLVGGHTFETQDIQNDDIVKVKIRANGCENWADTELKFIIKSNSNAFTPNGDGKNDLFLKGLDLTIFNRWGQVLYIGKDGWDGKFNGALVSPGTYFYSIKTIKSGSTDVTEKSGALTLILD